MDEFDSTSIESSDSPWAGAEKSQEQSEKQRESYKKAQAQIQRSQKDEKKAKWDNDNLFLILERFIQNPYYEELIPLVTELLRKSTPSRYIISLISLFYPEATIHLLKSIDKQSDIDKLLSLHREPTPIEFHESTLHPTIRNWMSVWVQSSQLYLTHTDMSLVMQNKLLIWLKDDPYFTSAIAECLYFFFTSRNLKTEKNIMMRYAQHIGVEYKTLLTASLQDTADDILDTPTVDDHTLFGLS